MANIASNRSPSPLSSRNPRNSETTSINRRSFNGNPFARPSALTNPRSFNPITPANSPATTDLTKRHSISRKSVGDSMFQDGKENHKDSIRSPAKNGSKNFMAPTISAASKFTPSPRKKVLGEKNELARTSIQFSNKDSDSDQIKIEEKKEVVFESSSNLEVITLNSKNNSSEMLSDVTENSDFVNVVESSPKILRPFCCSQKTSPIIAPLDDDPSLLPYDPKKNFLSPRPRFLRYKPNPRIEVFLNKSEVDKDYCGDERVTSLNLEDNVNLSESSSDTEEDHEEQDESQIVDSMESSEKLSESVLEEKTDSEIKKSSKSGFCTRSKTISFLSLMFLIACFSVSFTDSPPMDLPMYKDVSFSEIYQESLKVAAFAKESFDDFAENIKDWSMNLVSYLSKWCFSSSDHKIGSIRFFNLTISSPQDEFLFETEEIQELKEEIEVFEEEAYELEVEDEVETEEQNEILQPHEHIRSEDDDSDSLQTSFNFEDELNEVKPEAKSEMVENDLEIESDLTDSSEITQSETLSSLITRSINTISMAVFSVLMMVASIIVYMKSKAKTARIHVAGPLSNIDARRESCSSGTSSIYKKPITGSNKRESLASSSSDFSMDSLSYGSFTTFERIPIKKGEEEMLTPIRRSSRLMKNQVTSS